MAKKTARLGLFLALALICSYVESLIPFSFGIPGIKLGLANAVVLIMLYTMGAKDAITVSVLRIILSGFFFGNMFSILYSLSGGLLSFLVMYLLKRFGGFAPLSVSVAGGISHNIGQLLMAALVVESFSVFFYLPTLLIAGLVTGLLIGIVAGEILPRISGSTWAEQGKSGDFHEARRQNRSGSQSK